MEVKFLTKGDAMLSYCTVFSIYISLWSLEQQSDTLLLVLYYTDFFYCLQYASIKLSKPWQKITNNEIEEEDITVTKTLPYFTTPLSLLPFHIIFHIGLDRGFFYQFVCCLRLFSMYTQGRIRMKWGQRDTRPSFKGNTKA